MTSGDGITNEMRVRASTLPFRRQVGLCLPLNRLKE